MVNKPVSLGFLPLGELSPLPAVAEKIVKVSAHYDDWSCEITDSGKVTCQGENSDEGMVFGKENKALDHSSTPIEIKGIEQAESFTGTSDMWNPYSNTHYTSLHELCVLRKDDKIQCWGDEAKGVITYTP